MPKMRKMPKMKEEPRRTGWSNYSLFVREDGLLVGYLETEIFERAQDTNTSTTI